MVKIQIVVFRIVNHIASLEAAGSKMLVYKTIHHDNSEDQNLNSEHTLIFSEEYNSVFPTNVTNTGSVHQSDKKFCLFNISQQNKLCLSKLLLFF